MKLKILFSHMANLLECSSRGLWAEGELEAAGELAAECPPWGLCVQGQKNSVAADLGRLIRTLTEWQEEGKVGSSSLL